MKTGWSVPPTLLVARAKGQLESVTKQAIKDLFQRIVDLSPVDTGEFKGNWIAEEGAVPTGLKEGNLDPNGDSFGDELGKVDKMVMGSTMFLGNNSAYGPLLENGWSDQAPAGMVAISLNEWSSILAEAITKAKVQGS